MMRQIPEIGEFVAVDWSGAKSSRLPGLQMAHWMPSASSPRLLFAAKGSTWTRQGVWHWIMTKAKQSNGPLLVAFDMALGMAWYDQKAYFPGLDSAPGTARQLWREIDIQADTADDWYAGAFCRPPSPYAMYFNAPGNRGMLFSSRQRVTERVCWQHWTHPSSVFNCVGPGAVGIGSLAGMRMLHHIQQEEGLRVAIWPFVPVEGADIIVVEMFPRLYVKQAGLDPKVWKTTGFLKRLWEHYGYQGPVPQNVDTEDKMDALLSVVAIQYHVKNAKAWSPVDMTKQIAQHEGWIFGVT